MMNFDNFARRLEQGIQTVKSRFEQAGIPGLIKAPTAPGPRSRFRAVINDNWSLGTLLHDETLHAYDDVAEVGERWKAFLETLASLRRGKLLKKSPLPSTDDELGRLNLSDFRDRDELQAVASELFDPMIRWAQARDAIHLRREREQRESETDLARMDRLQAEQQRKDAQEVEARREALRGVDFGAVAESVGGSAWTW